MANEQATAELKVRYGEAARAIVDGDQCTLKAYSDSVRSQAALQAKLARPSVVRDALATIADVLASDLRRKASDRSDYLAYLMAQGKKATQKLWDAQQAFLAAKYGDAAEQDQRPLDPLLTVDERGLALEVFSADESAYARLALRANEALELLSHVPGVTHLQLDEAFVDALSRVRSYRETTLEIAPSDQGDEKPLSVPYRWVRAFSQVQAASTLPADRFELAPVDLYNVLLALRMRRAKNPPRALRYELVPGEPPRLVLEPWELSLTGTAGVYKGTRPRVVRTWGRRRLAVLARLLAHTKSVHVTLSGAGLPAFYVLDLGDASLTLALSGWTDSGWAGIATFDLLAAGDKDKVLKKKIDKQLSAGPKTLSELCEATGRETHDVRQALLAAIERGELLHQLDDDKYAQRVLFADPLDVDRLRYRDTREQEAHRLLATKGQVRLTKVHHLAGEGLRIEGEVEDKRAHRLYRTSFTLDREGRTVDADCSSPQFRRAGLKEGPSAPMIALRLLYERQRVEMERARQTPEGRELIRAETRTFVRRAEEGSSIYRVSLDGKQVVVRWGPRHDEMRMNRLVFNDEKQAREEYFGRLDGLTEKGFIDASAGDAV
jgi:hypothetical protein